MKYLLILLLIAPGAFAQDKITNLRVVCAAGKNPVPFTNPIEADKYAQTRPCSGRTYVEANYYYVSSSSKSSSSSSKSSSSSSSASSKKIVLQFTQPPYRPVMYSVRRAGGDIIIPATGDEVMTYEPAQPFVSGEKVSVASIYGEPGKYFYTVYAEAEQ